MQISSCSNNKLIFIQGRREIMQELVHLKTGQGGGGKPTLSGCGEHCLMLGVHSLRTVVELAVKNTNSCIQESRLSVTCAVKSFGRASALGYSLVWVLVRYHPGVIV
ncbi:hypothetical protein CEXT_237891 [Caerostris extrusa]|uniref:Uncharacterized protein n=1 Tax=Caerostris extrusa TaxID=172846 RepID=A0AAV4XAM6_CAEEX|nr:hypothetical protein CEXT_237891 [Caerostris extrusa]